MVAREVDPGDLTPEEIGKITETVFVVEDPSPADVLFMFGSSDIPDAVYRRLAGWVHAGWFRMVVVTGRVGRAFDRTGIPLAHTMRDELVASGVPADLIVVQDRSTNTFEDAEFGIGDVRRCGVEPESVVFVSKSHHAGRCLRTLRLHLPGADIRAVTYDYSYDGCPVTEADWWEHDTTRRRVYAEYLKITTYPHLQTKASDIPTLPTSTDTSKHSRFIGDSSV